MSGGGIETVVELLGDEIATLRADHDEAVRQREAVRATLDRVTKERDEARAKLAGAEKALDVTTSMLRIAESALARRDRKKGRR